ncbi:serine/arginine repetitive matrix protein 2 [Stomoxys calcitrans]|uniref:serine/arginine repetitive matrix protein 2 n=1 Tax=Stomoxys calcitrans TaxID=35570 RepID=UPI0027E22581|nr:serine/arginine repetitive matrix protein 2 [Stomoxys calcitrans]
MVVSKDSKRKRKESSPPPPTTPQQQQQASTAVESSPEMPKRTKVQAQRKFAQGQSAPQSSYSTIVAASSSSNTGPSTSSESREPPTEILPNKRPKTEDFLTFLCFRGTSALPPHLDFLNQGKSKEPVRPVKKPVKPAVKKKAKKGRPAKGVKQKDEEEPPVQENSEKNATSTAENKEEISNVEQEAEGEEEVEDTPSYPVRKRAEVITEGNRRSNRNFEDKCNNSTAETAKRRSNRSTKGNKVMLDHLSDEEEDEYLSALDENSKTINSDAEAKDRKSLKTPSQMGRKSESPSKESETTNKSRKGRSSSALKKKESDEKETPKTDVKERAPVKRPRQKESPIFIPSPEPSGRMTRQRAFFEPVKVPPRDGEDITEPENNVDNNLSIKSEEKKETPNENEPPKEEKHVAEQNKPKSEGKPQQDNDKTTSQANVFDFSSDDEQPLAKTIKLKKGVAAKASPKKTNQRAAKKSPQKKPEEDPPPQSNENIVKNSKEIGEDKSPKEINSVENPPRIVEESHKPKGKRPGTASSPAKNAKKKEDDELPNSADKELSPPSPKKAANNTRHGRKKTKGETVEKSSKEENASENIQNSVSPTRNQRPSRKTKEAATIYMGIIGHRLQLGEDEEDDVSLSSFDRPNVREMEKIENELKRSSADKPPSSVSPTPKQSKSTEPTASPPTGVAAAAQPPQPPPQPPAITPEKPTTGRRGRPPKNAKPIPPAKREIEGMLVKKGVIAKLTQSTENLTEVKDNKTEPSKTGTEDDEDFLLNEELNETKRKLERSFSDSDDEPLAIKAHVKPNERDDESIQKTTCNVEGQALNTLALTVPAPVTTVPVTTTLPMLALTTTKPALVNTTGTVAAATTQSPPPPISNIIATTISSIAPSTTTCPIASPPPSNAFSIQPPAPVTPTSQSPFKSIEKKSPVPTSKILNVPATYGIPSSSPSTNLGNCGLTTSFGKSPMYVPQSPAHYHSSQSQQQPPQQLHIRPTTSSIPQFPLQSPVKTSSMVSPALNSSSLQTHMATSPMQMPPQSPMKYQTPPTTYPPPIEAYPSPKINPNFLTPKFDRNTLSRPGHTPGNNNNFPSPSPVKFDMSGSSSGLLKNSSLSGPNITMSPKTLLSGTTNYLSNNNIGGSTSALAQPSNDPLKDEIGSILAANLMPSKEESGKIFGIASVSLAQSSGPDNTKCTLGKCGSIHKPVLGPVVPTESYIGDQLSGKERRKAKVNMTHEQIHKWLIECSSNPDEIQDDLDDDFDSDLRPNNFSSTPPPTRDDKESTSFSSSSKATRDLGKSESAWSAKGPSLKATPVVASSSTAVNNRKEDHKIIEPTSPPQEDELEKNSPPLNPIFDKSATNKQSPAPGSADEKLTQSEKSEKKNENKKSTIKEETALGKTVANEVKQSKTIEKEAPIPTKTSPANQKQSANQKTANQKKATSSPVHATTVANTSTATTTNKPGRKAKHVSEESDDKPLILKSKDSTTEAADVMTTPNSAPNRTPKRTPVYQQKQTPKQQNSSTDPKISAPTNNKRAAAIACNAAFSVDNEKSIYSFDKDDDDVAVPAKTEKPSTYRRQNRRDSNIDNGTIHAAPPATQRTAPTKPKRNAAAVAEIANKELAGGNSQTSSVSLTLSPSEKNKLVKVSLDADNKPGKTANAKGAKGGKKAAAEAKKANNENDSDSGDGHTFYIPLQGIASGGDGEGGIQGVAVKLGREGPDGPNQKVIMHATLVTKAQMRSNTKPIPETMNVSDIVKNLMSGDKKSSSSGGPSTSAAAAAAANSSANSLKNVPIGTVQPRFKGDSATTAGPSTSTAGGGAAGALQRVNSNSSLFSGSVKSRNAAAGASNSGPTHLANKKFKDDAPIKMSNNTAFPRHDDPTQMVDAPIFRPTEKEFADPIEFIERITPIAARFGICKIIPPASFKPECRIADEMRFTAYNQYVHKLLHRWGPSAKEFCAIKKYLATQSIVMNHPPWIGGMEVDLPRLYHTVQELGGLKEVIEKKKWARVAEEMCIPKLAQDRVTKLDDIYCKYLLPYDTLSPAERQKLFDEVEADWAKREARARRNADRFVNTESVSNEDDDVSSENDEEESEEEVDGVSMECIVKGRSMPLSQFYRIARNTMALWFKNTEPTVNEVEAEFWRHVAVRDSHVCVHSGSIDSSGWGFGFPSPGPKGKGSNYARHPWNLKVLTNNPGSVLRSLGPVMGVTVPTLHVGMLFSACCWYRDPHGLSWIEYLHTGASKLWYGIPDDQSANFRAALTSLIPTHCQNKTIWLPCDTVMVPPHMLTDRGVSLCRIEQKPGEFIVVFPRAYTSSLATGYVVSESVYFATTSWLDFAKDDFRDIHDSCEPAMFSLEQLLFALGYDQRVSPDAMQQMLPMLQEVYEKESAAREQLKATGVTSTEKVTSEKSGKGKKQQQPPHKSIESECDFCRANLYISMVRTDEGNIYCLQHALKNLNNGNIQAKQCKLIYAYNIDDIETLIKNLKERIQQKRAMGKKQK